MYPYTETLVFLGFRVSRAIWTILLFKLFELLSVWTILHVVQREYVEMNNIVQTSLSNAHLNYFLVHLNYCSFELLFIWTTVHLNYFSFELLFIWTIVHLSYFSFELFFIWTIVHLNYCSFELFFIWTIVNLNYINIMK